MLLATPVWAQNELSNTVKPPVERAAAPASAPTVQAAKVSPLNKNATDINNTAMVDTLQLKDMDIRDVFKLLSEKTGINIIAGQGISGQVTIYLKNVKLKDVLRAGIGIDAGLSSLPPDNKAGLRQMFAILPRAGSARSRATQITLKNFLAKKIPTLELAAPEEDGLDEQTVKKLVLWIDSLDRI